MLRVIDAYRAVCYGAAICTCACTFRRRLQDGELRSRGACACTFTIYITGAYRATGYGAVVIWSARCFCTRPRMSHCVWFGGGSRSRWSASARQTEARSSAVCWRIDCFVQTCSGTLVRFIVVADFDLTREVLAGVCVSPGRVVLVVPPLGHTTRVP